MDAVNLTSIPLFDGLAEGDLAAIAGRFQRAELLAGSSLAKQDDFSYKFFVVLDGDVEVYRDFAHVADLGAGEFFGEMGVVSGEKRNARVTAKTRCDLAWMMAWDFQSMQTEFPEIARRIDEVVAERMASVPNPD